MKPLFCLIAEALLAGCATQPETIDMFATPPSHTFTPPQRTDNVTQLYD